MSYTLKLKTEVIEIEQLDGSSKKYTINELTGKERDTYLNSVGSKLKFNNAGKTQGLSSYDNLQGGLLALCLKDENDMKVPITTIQDWPAGLVGDIFDKASAMSNLNKGADGDESGND